jgi:predicted Zn-dependent protease
MQVARFLLRLTFSLVLLAPVRSLAEGTLRAPPDPRLGVLDAAAAELDRSMKGLKLGDNEPPFFISLQVKDFDTREVYGKFGALYEESRRVYRNLLADVRVGSYAFDSTPEPDSFGGIDFDFDTGGYNPAKELPVDGDAAALRRGIWLQVDDQYKRALSSYLKKRGQRVYKPDDPEQAPSFSREKSVQFVEPSKAFSFADDRWTQEVRRVTGEFESHPDIFDADMRVTADKVIRYFASSEGSRLVTEQVLFGLHITATARAPDGMLLDDSRDYYGTSESELPHGAALDKDVEEIARELHDLRNAPVVDPFTGPALLSPQATGVLFHEAVGHRLEGDRQDDDNEGRTFKGQIGHAVLPKFISVVDDPSLRAFTVGPDVTPLNGYYLYDEQGVPAQRTALIEDGVLRNYLTSRRMVKGFVQSNGHGRSAGTHMPVARMGNLLVVPDNTVADASLMQRLIEEARRQNKPYGIYIKDITGGNTNTTTSGYQAFKGMSRLVYRVDAKTGKQELVRGVELVGTPLLTINRIIAMGDRSDVFNGFCGAESGYVPVSTVAPAALVGEFELQRTQKNIGRPPLLPAPPVNDSPRAQN